MRPERGENFSGSDRFCSPSMSYGRSRPSCFSITSTSAWRSHAPRCSSIRLLRSARSSSWARAAPIANSPHLFGVPSPYVPMSLRPYVPSPYVPMSLVPVLIKSPCENGPRKLPLAPAPGYIPDCLRAGNRTRQRTPAINERCRSPRISFPGRKSVRRRQE